MSGSDEPRISRYDRFDWLARTEEEAIDPNRPIVDPHHHLWDRGGSTYLAADLLADTRASHKVTHTVFVECVSEYDEDASPEMAPVGETRFVAEQAREAKAIGGTEIGAIVGHADMTLGAAVEDVLAAHDDAGDGLFRGIRHGTNISPHPEIRIGHHDPPPLLMSDPVFRAGVAKLGDMGYTFDAWLYFDQMVELAELAREVPDTTYVLDHLGGPLGVGPYVRAREDMLYLWRQGIAEVAACENVVLKVGGIGMARYYGTDWAERDAPPGSEEVAAHWRDMALRAIDAFGPDRCMFESNFPVDRETLPYTVLWNALQILGSRYSDDEQDDLFADTATRVYRIDRDRSTSSAT